MVLFCFAMAIIALYFGYRLMGAAFFCFVMTIIAFCFGPYLMWTSLMFLTIANVSKHKIEWFILSVLCVLLWLNKSIFTNTDDALYYIRAFMCFISALLLSYNRTKIGLYQAFILFLILSSYAALAFDVANNKHILIYNNFEGVIHGLVSCQFLGVFPEIWGFCYNIYTANFSRNKYNKRIQKI